MSKDLVVKDELTSRLRELSRRKEGSGDEKTEGRTRGRRRGKEPGRKESSTVGLREVEEVRQTYGLDISGKVEGVTTKMRPKVRVYDGFFRRVPG